MLEKKDYDIVPFDPVARFYYKGKSHTHPVRRTVLIIEDMPEYLVGYELRDGNMVRKFDKAPVKTYRKAKIARYGDYCRLREKVGKKIFETTLVRQSVLSLIKDGA